MHSITNSFLGLLLVFVLFILLHTSSITVTEQIGQQRTKAPFKVLYQELLVFKK